MIIGIDLGTTNSAIAVYGNIKVKGNYPAAMYLKEYNVSLIPSPLGEFEIPSAFWCDPNNPEKLVFGSEAMNMVYRGQTPILFSKRCIGTTQLLKIGEQEFTAKTVATEFLKYLKHCAEDALGSIVTRAVITHPAYFSLNQIEETLQAAIDAGFDMSHDGQMIMDPIAAAIAYYYPNPNNNHLDMIYDLGGGTFDVTVVEQKDSIVIMKAFEGDHLLGGYNFDRRLVSWLLDRVRDRLDTGRTFELDENDLSDQSSWSRLVQLAEKIKIQLSLSPTTNTQIQIIGDNIIHDLEGNPIQIIDKISREEYTALIQDQLDITIERSQAVMNKASVTAEDINNIILVGGSSNGLWVQETVKKAFPNNEVLLFNKPDLCVAIGAAIAANDLAVFSKSGTNSEFIIEADVPRISSLPMIHIIGTVKNNNGSPIDKDLLDNFYLMIEPDNNQTGGIRLNEDGNFIFRDVELLEDEETNLMIKLFDGNGTQQGELPLKIGYNANASMKSGLMQTVPKSLFIKTSSGFITLANEADILPVKSHEIRLVKNHSDLTFNIEVYQENERVATINVQGFPEETREETTVSLNVEITKNNILRGKVVVKAKDGVVLTESPVEISFPPIYIPDLKELKDKFETLENKRQEEILNERDPARRAKLGSGDKIARMVKALFAEEGQKDCQEINQAIKDLENLFIVKKDEFDPSIEEFNKMVSECEDLIKIKAESGENQKENSDKLARIQQGRDEAQLTRDKRRWSYSYELLEKLHIALRRKQKHFEEAPPLPETKELKDYFYEQIVEDLHGKLDQKIKECKSIGKFEEENHSSMVVILENSIRILKERIEAIPNDTKPETAIAKLQSILRDKPNIEDGIEKLSIETVFNNIDDVFAQFKPSIGVNFNDDLILEKDISKFIDDTNIANIKEKDSRVVPTSCIDNVHFTVSSPPTTQPGKQIIVDVWSHLERQRAEVIHRVEQSRISTDLPPVIRQKGPFKIERGTILMVRLKFPELNVEPTEDTILWEGEIGNASFVVHVPLETSEGIKTGLVTIHWEGGFQIARVPLQLLISNNVVSSKPIEHSFNNISNAFASYASEDGDDVLARIQGMQKVMPSLNVFYAEAELHSGEHWQDRLRQEILKRDVLYLFWSEAASRSKWVEWEWQCGYSERGIDFIDPCPLVSPEVVPPPKELADKLHFNDWILAFMRNQKKHNTHP